MKKVFTVAASLFLVVVAANAQTEKKQPPPPPPPPKVEISKFTPPTTIDEKVTVTNVDGELVKGPPVITIRGAKADEFYKENPLVAGISRQEDIITIKKKDGSIEKYDMSKKEEDKKFTEKYGVSPIPPPPPPPPKIVKEKKLS